MGIVLYGAGAHIESVIANGQPIDKIIGNGVTVWPEMPTQPLANYSSSPSEAGLYATVSWVAATGATQYRLERSVDSKPFQEVSTQASLSANAHIAFGGNRYRVIAINAAGESSSSVVGASKNGFAVYKEKTVNIGFKSSPFDYYGYKAEASGMGTIDSQGYAGTNIVSAFYEEVSSGVYDFVFAIQDYPGYLLNHPTDYRGTPPFSSVQPEGSAPYSAASASTSFSGNTTTFRWLGVTPPANWLTTGMNRRLFVSP